MSDMFEKYGIEIPQRDLVTFEKVDQEKIITFHIGKFVPRVLKDLDEYLNAKKEWKSKQISLIYTGKDDKRDNYKMTQYIKEYEEFFAETEISITSALTDILEELVKDMNLYTKNETRKKKFFNTLESIEGQSVIFTIGIITIGEHLIKTRQGIENGKYLENVLRAKKLLATEIKEVYKAVNREEITKEQAKKQFRMLIENKVQDLITFDSSLYSLIKNEEDLHKMCCKVSIQKFIYDTVEAAREKATRKVRLTELM